jgi:chromosome segregation protein
LFLRRLDLVGFKSFAPKSSTEFPQTQGIAVIVGPNGSGKSNIADAVLWVLGEQSVKAVRARKPEEVIFAGSASRQPLGMAEVSLILDNADGSLPIEFGEVRVTRRLYRSGDSEYLLNGSRVRLRDITQLLLHAGLSPDSYTVIGQGSIDELILQRPEERRVAFESAADIRRHQLKLNDTRAKLTGTEANLVRVQDVLAELAPHVRRLKGQADRAARVEASRAELHDLLVRWFRARLSRANIERRAAEHDLTASTQVADAAEAASRGAQEALERVDHALVELEDALAVLRPRAEGFREQSRAAERALAITRERTAGLGEQQASASAEVERLQRHIEQLTQELSTHALEASLPDDSTEQANHARLAEQVEQLQAQLASAQAERIEVVSQRDQAERQIAEAEARLARTEGRTQRLEADLAVDEARRADREQRLAAVDQLVTAAGDERAQATAALDAARTRQADVSAARQTAAAELETAQTALREARQQVDRLEGALQALGATHLRHENGDVDLPEAWREMLTDLPVLGLAGDLAPRVLQIDRLLRGYLRRAVVVRDDVAAREAHRRLGASLSAAEPAWAVLSLDGLLLTPAGARQVVTGSDEVTALADWGRQVRELESELSQLAAARRSAEAQVLRARSELEELVREEEAARAAVSELSARLEQVRAAEHAASVDLRRLRDEHQRSAQDAVQRLQERSRAASVASDTRQSMVTAREARDAAQAELHELEARVANVEQALSLARTELLASQTTRARRQAEIDAHITLRARVEAELATSQSLRTSAANRLARLGTQATELAEREAKLVQDVQTTLSALAPVEEQLVTAERKRVDLIAERRALEQQLAGLRDAERLAHATREEHHVRAQRAADDLERLEAEITETAELEGDAPWIEQLRLPLSLWEREAPDNLDAMHRRIASLQRELRTVGVVADTVIDEFRELNERHDFLTRQSEDLRTAMAELREAATELETHMRGRFVEVFEATQAAFQDCFASLFGGGEARLVLTDPDDLLRSGVDIVARPPGKKLQGLLSLSGGERALTVVALLFGLLRVHPTPFCVLDEVDAALDEANVQRFANLLTDFARRIQFIVVTHNRATMDKADALYGVSMDVDGISRIFSVRPSAVA